MKICLTFTIGTSTFCCLCHSKEYESLFSVGVTMLLSCWNEKEPQQRKRDSPWPFETKIEWEMKLISHALSRLLGVFFFFFIRPLWRIEIKMLLSSSYSCCKIYPFKLVVSVWYDHFLLVVEWILAGPFTVFTINSIELTPDHLSTKGFYKIELLERARVAAWLSLSSEGKEYDYYPEFFEIMPHEIGKYQNVLGLITGIAQTRSQLIVCYFFKLYNEKQEYVRSFNKSFYKIELLERARVAAWLSLSSEGKEYDYYPEFFEIMPHEIGKYQNVLGLITGIAQTRSQLIVCYFFKLYNEKQEYVRSFKDCWNTVA